MACVKQEDILAYLKGELSADDAQGVKGHAASCLSCLQYMNRLDALLCAIRQWKGIDPAPDFVDRVAQAVIEEHPEWSSEATVEPSSLRERLAVWKDRLFGEFRRVPTWAISAAAHVVLFAIFALIFVSYAPAPSDFTVLRVTQRGIDRTRVMAEVDDIAPRNGTMEPPEKIFANVDETPTVRRDVTPRESGLPSRPSLEDFPMPPRIDPDFLSLRIQEDTVLSFVSFRDDENAMAERLKGARRPLTRALEWLASHQHADGHWAVESMSGSKDYEVGLTALSLLAFLGDGQTHKKGSYQSNLSRGVDYLIKRQDAAGLIGGKTGHYMYNHGIATLALLEDYIMTRDQKLELPVLSALAYILYAQNPSGGWGYEARSGTTDTSVTVWLVSSLRLARSMGRKEVVPAMIKVQKWLTELTDEKGRVGYQRKGQYPNGYHTLTAVGMFSHLWTAISEDSEALRKQSALLMERTPVTAARGREIDNDLYYAYFGSLAMYQMGDDPWRKWQDALQSHLLPLQQDDGSWPADLDRWSSYGGQVYTTAMGALILETVNRYPRLKQR